MSLTLFEDSPDLLNVGDVADKRKRNVVRLLSNGESQVFKQTIRNERRRNALTRHHHTPPGGQQSTHYDPANNIASLDAFDFELHRPVVYQHDAADFDILGQRRQIDGN